MDSARREIAQQGHLISVGQAALELGVSGQSIRNWCRAGLLDYTFTAGGHRRLLKSSLREYQGLDPEPFCERRTAIYARVSTNAQKKEGNLDRQVERLLAHVISKGMCKEDVLIISEVGSGLNESRKGYLRFLDLVTSGELDCVVVEHSDRIARFGVKVFQALCEKFGVKIVVTNSQEGISQEEELSADVISILTVFSAKIHGRRAAATTKIELTPELKNRCLELAQLGLSQAKIADKIAQEGLTCPNTNKVFSIHAINLVFKQEEKLRKVMPDVESPVEQFIAEKCVRKSDGKCFSRPFYREFSSWAKARSLPLGGKHSLFYLMKRLGYGSGENSSGYAYFTGVSLRDNPRSSKTHNS